MIQFVFVQGIKFRSMFFSFFRLWMSSCSAPFVEKAIFAPLNFLLFCQTLLEHLSLRYNIVTVYLFLCSQFCSTDLCGCPSANIMFSWLL